MYIGRGSKWGNPFPIHNPTGNTREVVIKKYKKWLWEQIKSGRITIDDLKSLDGQRLGCFCKPLACHGDVLVQAIEWAKQF